MKVRPWPIIWSLRWWRKNPPEEESTPQPMWFSAYSNGIRVEVNAPADAFDEGTNMKVRTVAEGAVKDTVSDLIEGDLVRVRAIDISFQDAEGQEVEPRNTVDVSFKVNYADPDATMDVVHISDDGAAEVVAADVDSQFDIQADAFSVYVIIESADAETDVYEFYNIEGTGSGDPVRTQRVLPGDTMFEPATPPATANGRFIGWYPEDSDTPLPFGDDGTMTVESVSGKTIKVYGRYQTYYYATFYDQDGKIFSRLEVKAGDQLDIEGKLPTFMPKMSTQNLAGWTEVVGGSEDIRDLVPFPTEITEDVNYYPVIQTGHYIHFDANRISGMEEVNVSYTPPQFVAGGERTVEPATTPIADIKAYEFGGWYTDQACTRRFTFGGTLNGDITLYAKWTTKPVDYHVYIWQQKVTDDKNATTKTYDYVTSYTDTAAVGSSISYSSLPYSVRNLSYTGFTKGAYDSSITVKADGSSVLNIYYDRNLVTLRLFRGNSG